jgi:hypothetical protein
MSKVVGNDCAVDTAHSPVVSSHSTNLAPTTDRGTRKNVVDARLVSWEQAAVWFQRLACVAICDSFLLR